MVSFLRLWLMVLCNCTRVENVEHAIIRLLLLVFDRSAASLLPPAQCLWTFLHYLLFLAHLTFIVTVLLTDINLPCLKLFLLLFRKLSDLDFFLNYLDNPGQFLESFFLHE